MTRPVRFYSVSTTETPKRDVDLFGATTVRIDVSRERGGSAAPWLYLSAYVDDHAAFAARVIAALEWLDGSQDNEAARAGEVPNKPSPEAAVYSLPDYVEDVDWEERLLVAEEPEATNWKAWTVAYLRRVELATTDTQLARLQIANMDSLRACPSALRGNIARRLHERMIETAAQVAA